MHALYSVNPESEEIIVDSQHVEVDRVVFGRNYYNSNDMLSLLITSNNTLVQNVGRLVLSNDKLMKSVKTLTTTVADLKAKVENLNGLTAPTDHGGGGELSNSVAQGQELTGQSSTPRGRNVGRGTSGRRGPGNTNISRGNQRVSSQRRESGEGQGGEWELKKKVVPNWGSRFFNRRDAYTQGTLSFDKACLLSEHLEADNVYIPKKFRLKHARNRDHHNLLEKRALNNMSSQRDELLWNSTEALKKVKEIDDGLKMRLQTLDSQAERHLLLDLWAKETTAAETNSKKIIQKKLDWLKQLPNRDPYLGYQDIVPQPTENTRTWRGGRPRRPGPQPDAWRTESPDTEGNWRSGRP